MFNHSRLIVLQRLLRRYWLIAFCVAAFAGVVWIGAPAWAAPVTRPLNQTVPRPTPTSEGGPIATATPRPDDDDGDDGDSEGGSDSGDTGGGSAPVDAPNIVFPDEPGGTPSTGSPTGSNGTGSPAGPSGAPSASLTAQVNVNGLNLREGPGTGFNTLGSLPANTQVTVLARNEDGTWWHICCLPGTETTGWVSTQLLTPSFDSAQANTLIPVFGSAPATPTSEAAPAQATTEAIPQAEQPLEIASQISPYFVWQGITATLTITINNPNPVDAVNVVLSDELPEALTLIEAEADAGGTVETVTTASERPLLLFRWETIPADTAATVTIIAQVAQDLEDGIVIDNLVATRGRNVPYNADAITIGMPPVVPPDFQ